jgi:hypothetical protein
MTVNEEMTASQAEEAGRRDFKSGRPCAPVLNGKIRRYICERPQQLPMICRAYVRGWTMANLKEVDGAEHGS